MELRERLLTGQEGGSPCQKVKIFIFCSRQSSVFPYYEKQKNRLIIS